MRERYVAMYSPGLGVSTGLMRELRIEALTMRAMVSNVARIAVRKAWSRRRRAVWR